MVYNKKEFNADFDFEESDVDLDVGSANCGKKLIFPLDKISSAIKSVLSGLVSKNSRFLIKDNYIYQIGAGLNKKKSALKLCQYFEVLGVEWIRTKRIDIDNSPYVSKYDEYVDTYKGKIGYFVIRYRNEICLVSLADINFNIFTELKNLIYDLTDDYNKTELINDFIRLEAKNIVDFVSKNFPEHYQKVEFENPTELRKKYREALNLLDLSEEEKNKTAKDANFSDVNGNSTSYWDFFRQNLFLATRDMPLYGNFEHLNLVKTVVSSYVDVEKTKVEKIVEEEIPSPVLNHQSSDIPNYLSNSDSDTSNLNGDAPNSNSKDEEEMRSVPF